MNDIKPHFNMVVSGATQSGKTYLTKQLLKHQLLKLFDYIIILSPTGNISHDWDEPYLKENHNPKKGKVIQKFESDFQAVIQEVIATKKKLLQHHPRHKVPDTLIILDDLAGDKILRLGGFLDKISVSTRHYNVSMMILVQKITAVPRTFRVNTKYMVLFNATNFSELERFVVEYVPKRFQKILYSHIEEIFNEPYNFIFCNNFATQVKNRLYLNGIDNLYELLQ